MRAFWKCTKSQKLCILGTFWPISNFLIFCQNKNSLELLKIIFENSSPKGYFGANEKKKLNFCFCRRTLENYWQPLLKGLWVQTVHFEGSFKFMSGAFHFSQTRDKATFSKLEGSWNIRNFFWGFVIHTSYIIQALTC